MPEKNTIARPYAKALFEIAYADNQLDLWHEALERIAIVVNDPNMKTWLLHPQVSIQDKLNTLLELAGELPPNCKAVMRYIAEQKRLLFMPEIANLFETLKTQAQQVLYATLISAEPLDNLDNIENKTLTNKIIDALKRRFKCEQVILRYEIDDNLMAGAIIKIDNFMIDGSLQGRLKRVRDALGV